VPLTSADWPRPAHADRAELGFARWRERAEALAGSPDTDDLAAFARGLADDPAGGRMLTAIFGNSPFLTELALKETACLRDLVEAGPEPVFARVMDAAWSDLAEETDRNRLMAGLRRTRRRAALSLAIADIGGLWPVERITLGLSQLAEAAIRLAVRQLLRQLAERGAVALPDPADPETGSGLIVLGMGKLGARELNFSSDIDLIVLYDEAGVESRDPHELGRHFVRLTRELVRILEERTAEGYVFRTDLRLRPDPSATPLAVSVAGAEGYYGSMAQTWERSAMIKARQVAGDAACGEAFGQFIRQFVWRTGLDFAAIDDIHKVKRQINSHHGHAAIAVKGHDIKVGRGGIREIEFFVQTQQMIFGGREPPLRARGTLDGLAALADCGRVERETADRLAEAYRFLRRVEHRLQMIDDQQTQRMPKTDDGVAAVAAFLGYPSGEAFAAELRATLETVEDRYARLFEESPCRPARPPELVFTGTADHERTLALLAEMGFENPQAVAGTVRGWLHGRYRATRSERARQLLSELLPAMLEAVARTPSPDQAWLRLDEFIARMPTGVQLFSLFHANPNLMDLVAKLLGTSARLADHLAQHPGQMDAVLTPGFFETLPDADDLAAELESLLEAATDYEEMLNVLRRWTNDKRFQAGVHLLLEGPARRALARFLTDVAEVALRALQPRVEAEFARRHGRFRQGGLAVVAMGKLGGGEMSVRSDLDLIMVFDVGEGEAESDGEKPLSPGLYYARLIQRLLSAITAQTRDGALYEADMRLRPSGNAGPLATSLAAFRTYHADSAWTWEHMALTRARPISGPERLRDAVGEAIREVLVRPRDPDPLLAEVADMRRRIDKEHGTDNVWDVKYVRGGLIDIEFVAQYLQLREVPGRPQVLSANTGEALGRLVAAGVLEAAVAERLQGALALAQRAQAYLRQTVEGRFDPETAPTALLDGLARVVLPEDAADRGNFAMAEAHLRAVQADAHALFREIVETPAAALAEAQEAAG
jgi:glutamate-ammonia-ligase adenylyltransferase